MVLMASQSITFIRAASSAQRRRHARTRVPPSQTADAAARGVRLEGGAVHPLTLLQFYERRGLVHANINTRAGQAQDNYLVLGGLISPPPSAHIHGPIC